MMPDSVQDRNLSQEREFGGVDGACDVVKEGDSDCVV